MPPVDPLEIATSVAAAAREHQFAEIAALFAPPLRALVSADVVRAAWTAELDRIGAVTSIGRPVGEPMDGGLVRVSVPVTCERGGLTLIMSVDGAGSLNGLRLAPAATSDWTPPTYADPTSFTEQDVTLKGGIHAVQGTLSLPEGRNPAVVLLSGGGAFDRDETSGPNKPLKDLAWGLASKGIAVLRFDKVTAEHPDLTSRAGFTMTDEYLPHALEAIDVLRQHPAVDPDRIFLAGHSMGGKVAPRIAAASQYVAGLVILAGDTQPMHQAAVRVARYLAADHPTEAAESFVELLIEQAEKVESSDLSPSTPAGDLPFGYSGSYWLDLREYDQVATAATLDRPILILQGGRDYQVTVADDLIGWQAGLAHRPDVTIRVYEADNHLFFTGSEPSTMADYATAQHVDPAVIDDIATWIN
jgi:dienelactone hydrolase